MNTELMFKSQSCHWGTPVSLWQELNREFAFNDDPCPLNGNPQYGLQEVANIEDGLDREWGTSTWLNPPYGKEISRWLAKACAESRKGKTVVCLIPSRTDTRWWHCK